MGLFKIIKKYFKHVAWGLIGILALTIALNYVRSLVPLFISKIFNILDPVGNPDSSLPGFLERLFDPSQEKKIGLLIVFLGIIGTCFVRETLNIGDDILISVTGENIGYRIQTDFYNKVQALPYSYLNHCQTGDLIQRATNDVGRIKRLLGEQMPEILSNIAKLIIYGIQMMLVSLKLGGIIFAFIPLIFIIGIIFHKKMGPTFGEIEEDEGKLSTVVQENLTGIRVVKAFANEDLEIKKERKVIGKFISTWRKMMTNMSIYWATGDIFSYGLTLLAFALGVVYIGRGEMTLAQVIAIMLFVNYIMGPARMLSRLFGELGRTNIAANRVLEVLNMQSEYDIADGTEKPEMTGAVEFKNVSFQFGDANTPTINNVSFSIKPGQTVAILGKTGCGKSTLVSLLNRMLEVSDGDILFDGVSIKDINKKHLRRNVGLVLQESFLFTNTIAENIGVTMNKLDIEAVKEVSEIANVANDIERFQQKYDTIVGERGVTLSGGQKQRISIARTLVEKKPILIFDDSLSAVDTETDIKIRKALKSKTGKSTTFIITHRVITAKDADVIIVMEDGHISNIGTHEELINQEGLYKNIWHIQNYFNEEVA